MSLTQFEIDEIKFKNDEYNRIMESAEGSKMRFNVTYDKLELVVDAQYIDDSFEHAFGTRYQGYYEVNALFYNGTMIPLALVSEETLKILEEKINHAT